MTVSEESGRVGECPPVLELLFRATPARHPAPAPQLEIVFMESVNFPQILSSPDAEIKLKNFRFHKLNVDEKQTLFSCTLQADNFNLEISGCLYSACNAMCAVVCAVVYDSLVPSLVHFRKLVVAIKLILQIQQLSQNSSSNIQLSTLERGNFAKTAHFSICCCQRMLAGL